MPDFDATDLAEVFSAGAGGNGAEAATIGGGTVYGFLSHGYIETLDVAGTRPIFACAAADVAGAAEGDAVTIDGTGYTVAVIQPAGNGITRLVLTET